MVRLCRNRRVSSALCVTPRRRGTAILIARTAFLGCWMILLACGTGWSHPRLNGGFDRGPDRGKRWSTVGWYQAPDHAFRDHRADRGVDRAARQSRPLPERREHLGPWLNQHRDMSLGAQERALRNEPGFNRLSPATQQRLFNRLQQLNAMPAARRAQTLDRLETWQRLSPAQRKRVRNGIQEVDQMPMTRQRMMHRAIRDLSEFPLAQRPAILNSPQFRYRYSDHERQVLGTLMLAQPYMPLRSR